MYKRIFQLIFAGVLLTSAYLAAEKDPAIPAPAKDVAEHFNSQRMKADLRFLSSDLLEGRGTGARGGDLAAEYIATQFAIAGLKPAGEKGTYMQAVPLKGLTTQPDSTLRMIPESGDAIELKYLDDFVANDLSLKEQEVIDAPVIFAGFGINAPEYHWNDFAGIDPKGKVLLVMVNDPAGDDQKFFGGKAMTYYGRWTYKYEEAARQGAAGILLIHDTDMASYGWNVVRNSNSSEQAYLDNPPGAYAVPMAGWIQKEVARKALAAVGQDLTKLFEAAQKPGFKAIELPMRIQAKLNAKIRPLHAQNVAGLLEGSDPQHKNEVVVYSAHYDHLGIGVPVDGDNIYNGALDNASGTALLLEMARAYANSPVAPPRSILFLSVTGEERGLRGSEYYATHPLIPTEKIMLDLNYDGIWLYGDTQDVNVTGAERTTIWPIVQQLCKSLNFTISPEAHPEAGFYYRSDHFSFARTGVPAFSLDLGNEFVGKSKEYGEQIYMEYNRKHYHQPSDEFKEDWDYTGAAKLARLGIYIGWRVAELPVKPAFQPGDEFAKPATH